MCFTDIFFFFFFSLFATGCTKQILQLYYSLVFAPENLPNNPAGLSSGWKSPPTKQYMSELLSCSVPSSILRKTNAHRLRHWCTIFLLDAAAEHLEEGCVACPGWHARSWLLSSLELGQVQLHPLQACLEHPPAATVFYLCSVHDPVPVHDSLSICIEIKAHSALLTCLIIYTESQQEVTKMNSFPLYRM